VLDLWQPIINHTVNQLAFGPDGLLYVASGDGGCCGDPYGTAQDTDSLRGKVLRLDVSAGGPGYAVPPDNPFVDDPAFRPEIWAWGLRNPWKMNFDRETGELWLGDVGQDYLEEVNVIEAGRNYGWPFKEGAACYAAPAPCDDPEWTEPVAWIEHGIANSVTGGFVYRGNALPALRGAYIFGDYVHRQAWALFREPGRLDLAPEVQGPYAETPLFFLNRGLPTFLEDAEGELYVVASDVYGGAPGEVLKLVPPAQVAADFPATLSATGCFDPADPTRPLPMLIPYALNAPFWSDGAEKRRWVSLPEGTSASVLDDGDLDFPRGTVLAKEFDLDGLLETRLFMRHDDGVWAGYTYRWRDDRSDADLLYAGETTQRGEVEWNFPGRAACMLCHSEAANRSLGPELRQLRRPLAYPNGRVADQLATWEHLGLIDRRAELGRFFEDEAVAFEFDEVRTDVPNGRARTLSAWVRPSRSEDVAFIESVIDSDVPGQYGSGFGLDDGRWKAILDDQFWEFEFPAVIGEWQHVSLAFDGEWAGFYVDGALVAETGYAGEPTEVNFVLGRSNANDLFFHGELRDVRIFGRRLTDDEVVAVSRGEDVGVEPLPDAMPDPYADGPIGPRARAWLHTNCASCHRPGGTGRGTADYRYTTPLAEMGVCDIEPEGSTLDLVEPRLIAPGAPERSLAWRRTQETGRARMPPISSHVVDVVGTTLLADWIRSLDACE
jgi:hypothetical protein